MKSQQLQDLSDIAWKVLKSIPIDVLDEDSDELLENHNWELVNPRLEGDCKGQRDIGSGNILTALNLIRHKLVAENPNYESYMYAFEQVLSLLESEKLIRKKPEKQRQTFKVVK